MVKVSKDAKERKTFQLMPEGRQIIRVTKAGQKPTKRPQFVEIEAVNKDGITIKNRWDLKSDIQEYLFWLFYNTGCGLEEDENGECSVEDMVGRYAVITVTHNVSRDREVVDDDTGEVKILKGRTFANFGFIEGNAAGFDNNDAAVDSNKDDDDWDEDDD